jgi:hypothetical protein
MRRLALSITAALALLLAVPALAKAPATLTVDPNVAGKGSKSTLDAYPPDPDRNPRTVVLRVLKGVKIDTRAVAQKCTRQQANQESCPAKSRIGGGTAEAKVTIPGFPSSNVTIDVDLYLAKKEHDNDIAGVVLHAKEPQSGEEGHAVGRIRKIDVGKFGVETRFEDLDKAVKPPPGVQAHVTHVHLTFGKSRKITKANGQVVRVHLIRNPKSCDGDWEFQAILGYAGRGPVKHNGSTDCRPAS